MIYNADFYDLSPSDRKKFFEYCRDNCDEQFILDIKNKAKKIIDRYSQAYPAEAENLNDSTVYTKETLEKFRNEIVNNPSNMNFTYLGGSFKEIVKGASLEELSNLYKNCLALQQDMLNYHLKCVEKFEKQKDSENLLEMERQLVNYYNVELIDNVHIIVPLLFSNTPHLNKKGIFNKDAFGRKKNKSVKDEKAIHEELAFYKNLLLFIKKGIFCDIYAGFYKNETGSFNDVCNALENNSDYDLNVNQSEFCIEDKYIKERYFNNDYPKNLIKTIKNEPYTYEIYKDKIDDTVYIKQIVDRENKFLIRRGYKNARTIEETFYVLPDCNIENIFQLGRLDRYYSTDEDENKKLESFHKPYGFNKDDKLKTKIHIHLYSFNDVLFNKNIDGKDRDLANYDDFFNLHDDTPLENAEEFFDSLMAIHRRVPYGINQN